MFSRARLPLFLDRSEHCTNMFFLIQEEVLITIKTFYKPKLYDEDIKSLHHWYDVTGNLNHSKRLMCLCLRIPPTPLPYHPKPISRDLVVAKTRSRKPLNFMYAGNRALLSWNADSISIRTDDALENAKLVSPSINCDWFTCRHLCGL